MAKVILNHRVTDYATWKPIFDSDVPMHEAAGLTQIAVGQKAGDPNNVFVIWDVADAGVFEGMMANPELQARMQAAGVISAPELTIVE